MRGTVRFAASKAVCDQRAGSCELYGMRVSTATSRMLVIERLIWPAAVIGVSVIEPQETFAGGILSMKA